VHPLAPELTRRFASLHQHLPPSAQSWVEEQARMETRRSAPDLSALESAIRTRFPSSGQIGNSAKNVKPMTNTMSTSMSSATSTKMSTTTSTSMSSTVPAGQDVQAMAFIVLMQAANDAEQDLQDMANQVKAINNSKQQLRNLADAVTQQTASMSNSRQPCQTPVCSSLGGELQRIAAATAPTKHPVTLMAPATLTSVELSQLATRINKEADSLGDISSQMQLKLQMSMDQRNQFEQILSNIEKSMQDASDSIVSNMK
jgi:hypothetical protein